MAGGVEAAVSLAEVQAYARVETGEEEALLAGLVRTASALCEQFVGQVLIERPFRETVGASGEWQRLSVSPVVAIEAVERLGADGTAQPLAVGEYAIDIDSRGDGWVRLLSGGSGGRLAVSGRAGMGDEPNAVPEPLRQGIARLVAHLFSNRDGAAGEPPAAVTALWRPYRRVRLV